MKKWGSKGLKKILRKPIFSAIMVCRYETTYTAFEAAVMTSYDISEKAGVSIATVSRVLNGNNNVNDKTRRKVLDVIEQYEYTPNAFARGLGLIP